MKFEEKFPSLQDPTRYYDKMFHKSIIELHCLDKQKVKDFIQIMRRIYPRPYVSYYGVNYCLDKLENELGL